MRLWTALSLAALPLCLAIAGCPADPTPQDSAGSSESGTPMSSSTGNDSGTTAMPTTAAVDGSESTAMADGSTTAADSSTGAESSGSGSSTGEPCQLGTAGCACERGECEEGLSCDALSELCVEGGACPAHPEGEPNDDEANAIVLGEVEGCMVGAINGAIDEGDTDWFTYHGTVDPACNMDTTGLVDADPELPVCMFWECDQGNEQVVCFGMPEAVSPEGRPGCCGPANSVVFMQRECLGVGEQPDGTIYLQVRGPDTAQCVDYELAYLF